MARKSLSIIITLLIVVSSVAISTVSAGAVSAKLSKSKLNISAGKSYTLKLKNASGKIKWKSSKKSVAVVNSKGKVTAKKAGKASITATNNGKKYTCKVTVKNVKAKSILIAKSLSITKGSSTTIKCVIKPKNTTIKAAKWTSSNTAVATVNSKGKVTAKKSGIAVITAATKDGSKLKAKCTVTVLNKTVNNSVNANLNALKNYILEKGGVNRSGDAGIFGKYSDDSFDDSYSILYYPKEKMFRFTWYSKYTDDDFYEIEASLSFKYSLTGFDNITAEYANVHYDLDEIVSSHSADVSTAVKSYNPESTIPSIKITSNTSVISTEKLKTYINSDFKSAMNSFNNLLYSETGLKLADIGFEYY